MPTVPLSPVASQVMHKAAAASEYYEAALLAAQKAVPVKEGGHASDKTCL